MLSVSDLHISYGPIEVIHGIDIEVGAGECVALIGANGAGKSSTLKAICGLVPAHRGTGRYKSRFSCVSLYSLFLVMTIVWL